MSLLETLWPAPCAGCGAYGGPLCANCDRDLEALDLGEACSARKHAGAFRYDSVARSLVLGLKVRCLRPCAKPLAGGMARTVQRSSFVPDAVSWVPARPSARRLRGFDQAELLAREVSVHIGAHCVPTLRANERRDQVGLGRSMRALNARSAVEALPDAGGHGHRLLLIDDLITTGSTARACVAALRGGRWGEVAALAACRA